MKIRNSYEEALSLEVNINTEGGKAVNSLGDGYTSEKAEMM